MKNIFLKIIAIILVISNSSCKKEESGPSLESIKKSAISNYSNIVYASYSDSYDKAVDLKNTINSFVNNPSENTLAAAKQAWLDSRIPYLQTEVYRFYGGPIDGSNGPENKINAWPMDENYIDYVVNNANAGIINDSVNYPTINKDLIPNLNQTGGETNISTGYHAIEFLLWGQDLSATSAGTRPYTDYLTTGGTAKNQARRAQYLQVCADLLVENLAYLVDEWKPNAANYRAIFEAAPVDASIQKILLGMGSLAKGELSGQRMLVAWDKQNQEDEHSCFSDNTTNDIIYDALGIENIYYGRYTKIDGTIIDGTGINDVIKKANSSIDTKLSSQLAATKTAVEAIQSPFDQEIINTDGRVRVLTAITAIDTEANTIVELAVALGISLSL